MSLRDVSFTHPKHVINIDIIKIKKDHEYVLLSEFNVPQIYFKLASVSKNRI